jgi:cytochrome d ubiquinol oxidase subunit I
MYLAAFIVTGFLVAAAYAVVRLRGGRGRYERTALLVPLTVAALAAPVQLVVGDWIARTVGEQQPTKLAAFEGLGKTTKGAPIHVLGWYDADTGEVRYGIEIPKALSLLAEHDPNATIRGLNEVPRDQQPRSTSCASRSRRWWASGRCSPPSASCISSRGSAAAGSWSPCGTGGPWSRPARSRSSRCSRAGCATEVGRQPWVVYGVMRTSEAVTGANGVPVGYATLVVVYLALAVAVAWILRRLAGAPLGPTAEALPDRGPHVAG